MTVDRRGRRHARRIATTISAIALASLAAASPAAAETPITVLPLTQPAIGAVISPDGTTAYVTEASDPATSGTIEVLDLAKGTRNNVMAAGRGLMSPLLSPDGRRLIAINAVDGNVMVIDTASRRTVRTIRTGANPKPSTRYGIPVLSPDGRRLVVPQGGNTLVAVDVTRGKVTAKRHITGSMDSCFRLGIAFGTKSRSLIVTCDEDVLNLDAVSLKNGRSQLSDADDPPAVAWGNPAFAPDGKTYYLASSSAVTPVTFSSGANRATITLPGAPSTSPNNATWALSTRTSVYVPSTSAGQLFVLDRASRSVTATIPLTAPNAWGPLNDLAEDRVATLTRDQRLVLAVPGSPAQFVTIDTTKQSIQRQSAIQGATDIGTPSVGGRGPGTRVVAPVHLADGSSGLAVWPLTD